MKFSLCLRLLSLSFLSIFYSSVFAQNIKLSHEAKISVVTVAPGTELYSAFGHTLLCVQDPVNNIDKAYSYGTFDFNAESFYWKFLRGTLPYQISETTLDRNVNFYQNIEKRAMTEQILDLGMPQKQKIFDHLEKNLLPENKEYAYKFFHDNCSTRVRDALLIACDDSLHLKHLEQMDDYSYRDWMNKYLSPHPWAAVGMNMAIGAPSDKRINQLEACYLPDNLRLMVKDAKRLNGGRIRYLVDQERPLFQLPAPEKSSAMSFLWHPATVFSLLFFLVLFLTYRHWKFYQKGYWLDKILFGFVGFLGWILLFLWFGTDHGVTNWNKNLFWALPLHLPLIFLLKEYQSKSWYGYYFLLTGLLLCFGLFFVVQYSFATIPFVATLFLRAIYHAGFEHEHKVTGPKIRKIIHDRKVMKVRV
jgi:hypothetical protein